MARQGKAAMKIIALMLTAYLLIGCNQYMMYQEGKLSKAKAETQDEITQLTRDYRVCLQSTIGDIEKQKGCAVYQQALIQLDVKNR
jgi:hypothetical protein